ncbi:GNAT family N-acetyltransferase [Herbiconiux sp. KACC 21604]|uniref:GNAT family N-acetyltransferase n=1 Tax=unclassified Herbiconiux TaxID=2618217 RepID=UPI0014910779|nr:GNAT family N-acetyltransferase [Herbiconiux sp. SALV-R1]QJU54646.1 GNAT family N-acetyltransferase [Herbiconiux sp. SALV-R1]WPO85745.1 GNAT family N-acetyltransferase [Herbiconiux sp. KACC 21604]
MSEPGGEAAAAGAGAGAASGAAVQIRTASAAGGFGTATGTADRDAIAHICIATGDAGTDARAGGFDTAALDALVARYATPYLDLEPAFAVVAEVDGRVVGYALGALDTAEFAAGFEQLDDLALTPGERREHAAGLLVAQAAGFPSHLHIDLLPEAQGHGLGRRLIEELLARLAAAGSPGVHLGVDPRNSGALAFYPRVGFVRADGAEPIFTRRLAAS